MDKVNFDDILSGAELAAWCDVSPKRIDQLLAEGVVHRAAKGKYALKSNVISVFGWLRSTRRRSSRSQADAEWRRQRAREVELRVAERERRLIGVEDAFEVVDVTVGLMRSEISGLPARITRDIGLRRQIEMELNNVLSRVVEKLAAERDRLQGGGEATS